MAVAENIEQSKEISSARRVFQIESDAIISLSDRLGQEFVDAVHAIFECRGRVIVTGIGKSGLIGKKIAATLSSTGTPAFFLHPADAGHGDVGMVTRHDIVLCLSKSGNTGEISSIIPVLKKIGVKIITMTGNLKSALTQRSDIVLDVGVQIEACPNDLAPTASTTAMLAMGDALAIALLQLRDFKEEDFAFLHPGGDLGRQYIKIDDIMFTGDSIPVVKENSALTDVILEMSRKRFGGTCVLNKNGKLAGIITDGDLRRLLQKNVNISAVIASDIMNPHPKVSKSGTFAIHAFKVMSQHNIMQIVIVNDDNEPVGMVHLHDLLEAGIGKL